MTNEKTQWDEVKIQMPKYFGNNILIWLTLICLYWLAWTAFSGISLQAAGVVENTTFNTSGSYGVPISQPLIFALLNIVLFLLPYSLPERLYAYRKDHRGVPVLSVLFKTIYLLILSAGMGISLWYTFKTFGFEIPFYFQGI